MPVCGGLRINREVRPPTHSLVRAHFSKRSPGEHIGSFLHLNAKQGCIHGQCAHNASRNDSKEHKKQRAEQRDWTSVYRSRKAMHSGQNRVATWMVGREVKMYLAWIRSLANVTDPVELTTVG
jgi:hypothetical protein